jgi:hypothetical protein
VLVDNEGPEILRRAMFAGYLSDPSNRM